MQGNKTMFKYNIRLKNTHFEVPTEKEKDQQEKILM